MTAMKILVIGCGPGGMFFCHAMETRRQAMIAAGESIANFPQTTAMERSSGPGGVWKSNRTNGANLYHQEDEKKTCAESKAATEGETTTTTMYEGLWTNGPKESIEFFDYTYQDHFGHALPVYMPRRALLEYMLARVTRNCPDFFDKYAQFNMDVQSVVWNEKIERFEVIARNALTGTRIVETYHKCIWGAGINGVQKIPTAMVNSFHQGGFAGRIIHSSDTSNFKDDVEGKRVLMIGGSYSAEDLALTAIKLGVNKIYISSRITENVVSMTTCWPDNKVTLLLGMQPVKVSEGGNCIHFASVEAKHGGQTFVVTDESEMEIRNIDTVILCTGYDKNMSMLSAELRAPFFQTDLESPSCTMDIPSDWKMDESSIPDFLHGISPGTCLWFGSHVAYPDLYRWTMIDNPNMMFIFGDFCEHPILATDAIAWLFASMCTGHFTLPAPEEMRRLNKVQALHEMATLPMTRYNIDSNFFAHVESTMNDLPEEEQNEFWEKHYNDNEIYSLSIFAQIMRDGQYPLDLGTMNNLNDVGKYLFHLDWLSSAHRETIGKDNENEKKWRTFRDIDDSHEFKSIYTGVSAVPLKKRWIDIDDSIDMDILEPPGL